MMLPDLAPVPPTVMPVAFTSITPLPAFPENVLPITRVPARLPVAYNPVE